MYKKNIVFFTIFSFFSLSSVQALFHQDNTIAFIKGVFKNRHEVGAFFPCSRFAAKEVCSIIEHNNGPLRILEIGPGTGALTKTIVQEMHDDDSLDLVEIMPDYCNELSQVFGHLDTVSIWCGSILDWRPHYQYDVIICSIPFNRFDPEFVRAVIDHVITLGKPGARFSYVELMWVTDIKKAFMRGQERQKLEQTMQIMKEFRQDYGIHTESVYLNITPLYVHHLQFN